MASLTFIYNLMASNRFACGFISGAFKLAVGDKFVSRSQSLKLPNLISLEKDFIDSEAASISRLA